MEIKNIIFEEVRTYTNLTGLTSCQFRRGSSLEEGSDKLQVFESLLEFHKVDL